MMTVPTASWQLHRLGTVMEPNPADPYEVEGVLNPAVAHGPDGHLYLLPRLVGAGNYSRIGLARVLHDSAGRPSGVERLGVALEPETSYELNPHTGGGVEDPRVTYVPLLQRYVMTYTAFGPAGPRVAMALSPDLVRWSRQGLVRFTAYRGIDLSHQDNKDAVLFPDPVRAPDGRFALALIHRPIFDALSARRLHRVGPSMWLSYAPLDELSTTRRLVFGQHHLLASPRPGWERLRVGAGTPPVRVGGHWLLLYHGVSGQIIAGINHQPAVHYAAGAMLLDGRDPRHVVYRSECSVLTPEMPEERRGIVPDVVFPTGLDARPDESLDVYYGMADTRIGVARTHVDEIPTLELGKAA